MTLHFSEPLSITTTPIPGMFLLQLPVHGDNRGWFKENWQREKMMALGLPEIGPVQNNISFNATRGTTRGIHAEPWDKFISVATGSVFGAWVDLRQGDSFGSVFHTVIDPSVAVFVPRGVGNSFQTLEDATAYTYLVNDHWSADAQELYTFVNLADETLNIPWPISLEDAELSEKDRNHPDLASVQPMRPRKTLVLGASGQLGRALKALSESKKFEHWVFMSRPEIDLAQPESLQSIKWSEFDTVINAAAYTDVDGAESGAGRAAAWLANSAGVAHLAELCVRHRLTLVHISTDYVFDGSQAEHDEAEPLTPLGVYGQSKAAGELAAKIVPRHYIVRTSWVIGDGKNFVRTMAALAAKNVAPEVVNDQIGRLTFANDLAAAIVQLLQIHPEYGIYNITNSGQPKSWWELAQAVFALTGHDPKSVRGVSTKTYFEDREAAPRPLNSAFDLGKTRSIGIELPDQMTSLASYCASLPQ